MSDLHPPKAVTVEDLKEREAACHNFYLEFDGAVGGWSFCRMRRRCVVHAANETEAVSRLFDHEGIPINEETLRRVTFLTQDRYELLELRGEIEGLRADVVRLKKEAKKTTHLSSASIAFCGGLLVVWAIGAVALCLL